MNYRIQAWENVAFTLVELCLAGWFYMTSETVGMVLGLMFAAVFAVAAVLYFRLAHKRQPRIVIKAPTLADAQRIIENMHRKDVR